MLTLSFYTICAQNATEKSTKLYKIRVFHRGVLLPIRSDGIGKAKRGVKTDLKAGANRKRIVWLYVDYR